MLSDEMADVFNKQININGSVVRCVENWNSSFDKLVKEFVLKFRQKGYQCDIIGNKYIDGGKATLLQVSQDGVYFEKYQLFYSGLMIGGEYVG